MFSWLPVRTQEQLQKDLDSGKKKKKVSKNRNSSTLIDPKWMLDRQKACWKMLSTSCLLDLKAIYRVSFHGWISPVFTAMLQTPMSSEVCIVILPVFHLPGRLALWYSWKVVMQCQIVASSDLQSRCRFPGSVSPTAGGEGTQTLRSLL